MTTTSFPCFTKAVEKINPNHEDCSPSIEETYSLIKDEVFLGGHSDTCGLLVGLMVGIYQKLIESEYEHSVIVEKLTDLLMRHKNEFQFLSCSDITARDELYAHVLHQPSCTQILDYLYPIALESIPAIRPNPISDMYA